MLHAVAREEVVDRALDEDFGVFELGRPRVCADDELAILLPLDGVLLDRKVEALLQQVSQTGGLVERSGGNGFARGSPSRASPSRPPGDGAGDLPRVAAMSRERDVLLAHLQSERDTSSPLSTGSTRRT